MVVILARPESFLTHVKKNDSRQAEMTLTCYKSIFFISIAQLYL